MAIDNTTSTTEKTADEILGKTELETATVAVDAAADQEAAAGKTEVAVAPTAEVVEQKESSKEVLAILRGEGYSSLPGMGDMAGKFDPKQIMMAVKDLLQNVFKGDYQGAVASFQKRMGMEGKPGGGAEEKVATAETKTAEPAQEAAEEKVAVKEPDQEKPAEEPQHVAYTAPEEGTGAGAPEVNTDFGAEKYITLTTPGGENVDLSKGFNVVTYGQGCERTSNDLSIQAQVEELKAQGEINTSPQAADDYDTTAVMSVG